MAEILPFPCRKEGEKVPERVSKKKILEGISSLVDEYGMPMTTIIPIVARNNGVSALLVWDIYCENQNEENKNV